MHTAMKRLPWFEEKKKKISLEMVFSNVEEELLGERGWKGIKVSSLELKMDFSSIF